MISGSLSTFFDLLVLVCVSGVALRVVSTPLASRFLRDSFFSRCSRAGALRVLEVAASGLRGEETAGMCCSSSRFIGRFGGIVEGVALRGLGGDSVAIVGDCSLADPLAWMAMEQSSLPRV